MYFVNQAPEPGKWMINNGVMRYFSPEAAQRVIDFYMAQLANEDYDSVSMYTVLPEDDALGPNATDEEKSSAERWDVVEALVNKRIQRS